MPVRKNWFDLDDPTSSEPAVAITGLPFDGAVSRRPGAALAPARIREISCTTCAVTRRGHAVSLAVRDFGDIPCTSADGTVPSQRELFAAALRQVDSFPPASLVIGLGGDNSVSIPLIQSFARRHGPNVGVIWFDAHPDAFEVYDGSPDSHACALRRAAELAGIAPSRIVMLGARSFAFEELAWIRAHDVRMVTAAEWNEIGESRVVEAAVAQLASLSAVYVAIDIDGFDASVAPGTGYPMPAGISSGAFFTVLEGLFERLPIAGMDITEVAPALDTNDVTSFLATQVVLEALFAVEKRNGASAFGSQRRVTMRER
jgi:agmatinase